MNKLEGKDVEGEKVLLRTDLNLPIENGEPRKTVRFQRYMETVKELSERGARTMVIAHQGRPARKDFLSLRDHAELMSEELDREVGLVSCFFGNQVYENLEEMEKGEVLLLENIRMLSEELQNLRPLRHSHDFFVRELADHFDIYVNDAFSAAHRSHGSLVGFAPLLDSFAGPVMRRELENCGRIRDEVENPLLVLGGEKPSDLIGMMEQMIDRADKVLLGGIPGELALITEGYDLGGKKEWIRENNFDTREKELEQLLDRYGDKIVLPKDVKTDEDSYSPGEVPGDAMTWDIGEETRKKFVEEIKNADSVVMKGPMGAFEDHPEGTKAVVEAIASSEAYTVLGGGHTSSLVHRFDHDLDEFTHVSIAGGAFVRYMSGEKLAAVEALEKYS